MKLEEAIPQWRLLFGALLWVLGLIYFGWANATYHATTIDGDYVGTLSQIIMECAWGITFSVSGTVFIAADTLRNKTQG